MLQTLIIPEFKNSEGTSQQIHVTFRLFGPPPGTAPVVLVNHALTGNSQVTGENGWWKELVGPQKCIDSNRYTILSIDIPGNGASGNKEHLIHNYTDFRLKDIAKIQLLVLEHLKISALYAVIGGSIGGALAWELAALQPELIENVIPVATDYKATDWVLGQCKIQDQILNNSVDPVHDARMHAMTFYRTPGSFSEKFRRKKNEMNQQYEVNNWLSHHGRKLENRFELASYKLMNHLLTTIDISAGTDDHIGTAAAIKAGIHIIAVDSDLFFLARENKESYSELVVRKKNVQFSEINSIHGHDAFLIENAQLEQILSPIFNPDKHKNENNKRSAVWNG